MNKISFICLLIISTLSTNAIGQTRSVVELEKDLRKAAKACVEIKKQNGMVGLINKTEEYYKNQDRNKFYCVYFDIASRRIDQIGVSMNFPSEEFFSDDQFGERVGMVFIKANMNMSQANQFLSAITPVINRLVDENILKKK
jgi:hypothetical protein